MRKRTSVVWSLPKEDLSKLVKNSDSLSKVLKYFNLQNKGGNYKTLKRRLDEENIDYSHIKLGQCCNIGRKFTRKDKIPLEKIMIENSTYNRNHLKTRLISQGILKNKCSICGLEPEWYGKKLVMVIDHINGINNDNRLENLRLLCPNCNSQQDTFCGKHNKKNYYFCKNCGKEIKSKNSKLCKKCANSRNRPNSGNRYNRRKVKDRPSIEILELEIKEMGYCAVGRKYGVSDNAVRKWLKRK